MFIQKTDGWCQFYVQAGAYNIPALSASFLSMGDTLSNLNGPLPIGSLKLAPTKNFNILIAKLPTLTGSEYTFTFQNVNIERGLLWNQENAINRRIQVNDSFGRLSVSFSWNGGFYSNRYTWLSGSLAYTFNAANSLSFVAGGNWGHAEFRSRAIPVQNNSSIYNIIYMYTKGNWFIQPYFQYTNVTTDQKTEIVPGAATRGGALLVQYKFDDHLWLASRGEYISSTGSAADQTVNLLFGPGAGPLR